MNGSARSPNVDDKTAVNRVVQVVGAFSLVSVAASFCVVCSVFAGICRGSASAGELPGQRGGEKREGVIAEAMTEFFIPPRPLGQTRTPRNKGEELLMPLGGTTPDENTTVSPWTTGEPQGVLGKRNQPAPALPRSRWYDPSPTNSAHQPPPPWPLALGIPPRLRRGAHSQGRSRYRRANSMKTASPLSTRGDFRGVLAGYGGLHRARVLAYKPPFSFGSRQTKFAASFVSPFPLYTAIFG